MSSLRELTALQAAERASAEVLATCLATVAPEVVRWLWRPRLPAGKLGTLEGDPGQGKSSLTLAFATALSLGRGLPGDDPTPEGETLLLTAEDGLADTLRPRLDAMGADVRRIHAIAEPLDLSPEGGGLAVVEREVARLRPLLVVVDPVVAYLGGRTDMHRANEVRAILACLAQLAEAYGCTVLAVRHLSKARAGRALHAGSGSVDFTAAARSVLLAGSTADGGSRALVHVKSNLGPLAPALGYSIDGGRFAWSGPSSLTAADLLGAEDTAEGRTERADAAAFLREVLADGPMSAAEVQKLARQQGLADRTVRRAKAEAGVVSRKRAFGSGWEWLLAEAGHEGGQGVQEQIVATLGEGGHLRQVEGEV